MASNDEQRSATTILTTAAQSIAARLIANETTAKFTKAEISTTNLFNQSVTELQVLTSLDNVQQTADINTVTVINNNTVNVNVAIDQTKAPNNYQMNSVGLFAVDGDGKEVLYSVTVLKDPVYIHQDAMGSALGIDLETVVGQASNVEISVNPAGAVTNEILKAALADYVKADDSTVVHTADMRKPANQVASIDEVNTKQDKIGYTPADDSKVVHDNHDGTEQLNGVQVQPFNKLTDTVGGRNLLPISNYNSGYINAADGTIASSNTTNKEVVSNFIPVDTTQSYYCQIVQQVNANQAWQGIGFYDANEQFISRYTNGLATVTGTITSVIRILPFGSPNISIPNVPTTAFPKNTAYVRVSFRTYGAPIQASLEKTSVLNDWTPAPEDKVNVADMRKPASDVAGIDEVSTLQTQVNNSAVGTNLLTGTGNHTVTGTGAWITGQLSNETTDDMLTLFKGLEGQTVTVSVDYKYSGFIAGIGNNRLGWEIQIDTDSTSYYGPWYSPNNSSGSGRNSLTFVVPENIKSVEEGTGFIMFSGSGTATLSHLKLEKGSVATPWCPNPSEILTKSDDSKVVHLSGANNFDTVPTVNNNPLLLASSLPSDLARTGQDQEFTGKNTFDVAPIDKTTGNPYITKDGVPAVPSTLADTTKLSNFTAGLQSNGTAVATQTDVTTAISVATANMVDRNPNTGVVSEPVDFTKLTVNGGKSVATRDDLKSLEASAWKLLVNSDATTAFYRLVDGTLYISGYARVGGNGGNTYASLTIVSQLPTELQNKVWTIQKKMTVGLNSGNYAMTAGLSFGKDSSLSATSSVPNGWTHDGIVIFNNSYTQS